VDYRSSLEFLYGLQKFGIKFGLNSTENILKSLGNPHANRKYIHVGGTNGKGSVCAFINSILIEAGYKVGFYSSPHLVTFRERFQINGEYINESDVVDLVTDLKAIMKDQELPTFFEVTTAMALSYFNKKNTDIDILEVGMGGRLDATNVVTPLVSVITNVSLEHQQYLGKNIKQIAFEKAGIIKKGVPVVTSGRFRDAKHVILKASSEKDAPCYMLDRDFWIKEKKGGYCFSGLDVRLEGLKPGLIGSYQRQNLGLAVAAVLLIKSFGFKIEEEHIRTGVSKAFWPGRFQLISQSPKILLDGAHNPNAMRALRKALWRLDFERLILVIGIMSDKDKKKILKEIVPYAHFTIFTRPKYYRAEDPRVLAKEAEEFTDYPIVIQNLDEAIQMAKSMAMGHPKNLILITGSLFTVGEALQILDPQRYKPDPL